MIQDFEDYKKIKKFPNYMIYINCRLLVSFLNRVYYSYSNKYCTYRDYCEYNNYQIYKSLLFKDIIKDNEFFFSNNLVHKTILNLSIEFQDNNYYCHFYMNEKQEGILIYLNNNNYLCYKNIETFEKFKKLEIKTNIDLNNIDLNNVDFLKLKKEYLLIYNNTSFEVFEIDDNKAVKICKKEKNENDEFISCTINYFNKQIYVSIFYKYKIYIYNIFLNQLDNTLKFNEQIMYNYSNYFLSFKNIYDFLFVTTEKQGYIYDLKKFSLKKEIFLPNIDYVLLTEISNRNCLIISFDEKISIIDFESNDIIFEAFNGRRAHCIFLWNQKTIILNSKKETFASNEIIDLFDGETKTLGRPDYWWTKKFFRIKLKKYGECLLRIGEGYNAEIDLIYIDEDK